MVNVINNSVLHTYNDGANASVFYSVGPDDKKDLYESVIGHIIEINRHIPCNVIVSKPKKSISISFAYKCPTGCLDSAKMSLDFLVKFRSTEELDLCFSNFYNYITQVIGYSVSDYFKCHDDMPCISEEKDFLYIRVKPKMLMVSGDDIFGNNTIVIDFIKDADYE